MPDSSYRSFPHTDGETVLIGRFGLAGQPVRLIDALLRLGAGDLTVVSNNAGNGYSGLAALFRAGRVEGPSALIPASATRRSPMLSTGWAE